MVSTAGHLARFLNKNQAEGGRFELREDLEQVDPKSCVTPETSKGNEAAAGSRTNPEATRKSATCPEKTGTVPATRRPWPPRVRGRGLETDGVIRRAWFF